MREVFTGTFKKNFLVRCPAKGEGLNVCGKSHLTIWRNLCSTEMLSEKTISVTKYRLHKADTEQHTNLIKISQNCINEKYPGPSSKNLITPKYLVILVSSWSMWTWRTSHSLFNLSGSRFSSQGLLMYIREFHILDRADLFTPFL